MYTSRRKYNVVLVMGLFGFETRFSQFEWTHFLQISQTILDKFTTFYSLVPISIFAKRFLMNKTQSNKPNLFSKKKNQKTFSVRYVFSYHNFHVQNCGRWLKFSSICGRCACFSSIKNHFIFSTHDGHISKKEWSTHMSVCFAIYWLICVQCS